MKRFLLILCITLLYTVPVHAESTRILDKKGIDVSSYQGIIDWKSVSEDGVDFAFVRCYSAVSGVDNYFDYNMSQANAIGLPVGVYIYSGATTDQAAQQEVDYIISCANRHVVNKPLVLDLEGSMASVGYEQLQRNIQIFCNSVRNAGYVPMVYASTNFFKNHIGKVDCLKWEANYKSDFDWENSDADYWQKSSHEFVKGIQGRVDVDYSLGYQQSYTTVKNSK